MGPWAPGDTPRGSKSARGRAVFVADGCWYLVSRLLASLSELLEGHVAEIVRLGSAKKNLCDPPCYLQEYLATFPAWQMSHVLPRSEIPIQTLNKMLARNNGRSNK